ncbi:MAG: xanthine dehydrogenase family protein molybdopterin-binding subunit, partial [Streptosporangiaceae bacterium]
MNDAWTGRSVPRREDDRLLRGAGRYVDDIDIDGQLHAAFVRSPIPHGLIRSVDTAAARAMPGVVTVAVLTDFGAPKPMPPFLWDRVPAELLAEVKPTLNPAPQYLLAHDRVRFVGEAVAVVVAESRYRAEDAAEYVDVDYEELPPVAAVSAAVAPGAAQLHSGCDLNVAVDISVGSEVSVAAAAAGAAHVVRARFETHRQTGLPIETRGALADAPTADEVRLWSATQNPHALRRAIARLAGRPEDSIRVIAPDVGGGFGVKGVLYAEDVIVALLAARLRRPVKWIEDRYEFFFSSTQAREQIHDVELWLSADGDILAFRDHFDIDCGAYNPLGLVMVYNTIAHLCGPYRVPYFAITGRSILTNKVPTAPYRGAGRPEGVFAFERLLDTAARQLGLDPLTFRLRNMITPAETPYRNGLLYRDGQPIEIEGSFAEMLTWAATAVEHNRSRGIEDPSVERLGIGMGCYIEGTGIGPFEGASVHVDLTGSVFVSTGTASQGQSHETVFAQICADQLGVDPESVTVTGGDTAKVPNGWGAVASRSAVVAGSAVFGAASEVAKKARELAAHILKADLGDVVLDSHGAHVVGIEQPALSLAELSWHAIFSTDRPAGMRPDLRAVSYFEPRTVTWASGAHAAAVLVNTATGEIRLLDYAIAHDCGRALNPAVVEDQIIGGLMQGLGGALLEELVYGEDGQLLTASLADYLLPTVGLLDGIQIHHMESESQLNPLGAKGIGEAGTIPVAAVIANAVQDALGPDAALITEAPLTPIRVVAAIEAGSTANQHTHHPAKE